MRWVSRSLSPPPAVHSVGNVEEVFVKYGFRHITCPDTAIAAVNVPTPRVLFKPCSSLTIPIPQDHRVNHFVKETVLRHHRDFLEDRMVAIATHPEAKQEPFSHEVQHLHWLMETASALDPP